MEILVVGSHHSTGGIQRYIDQQSEHLSKYAEVRIYDTEIPAGSGLLWLLYAVFTTSWDAVRFPLQRKPDLVHVHTAHWFSFYRASFYIIFAAKVWRVPALLHVHGSSFDDFLRADSIVARLFQRITFAVCSEVIVLSEYWRNEVTEHTSANHIIEVPNAVDPEKYTSSPGAKPPSILFISHLTGRKGVEQFLEAVSLLADEFSDFEVHIAGDGPKRNLVEDYASRLDNITYYGYVPEDKKRELLALGSIYVLPSQAEGLPIAILEAMASGNAIISTEVGGIPDVIKNENGRLIPPTDPVRLTEELSSLMSSPEETRSLGENNREKIEEDYNWQEVSQTMYNIYKTYLGDENLVP